MSGVGRLTMYTTGGLLLVILGGVLLMINALDKKLEPACLKEVAPVPDGVLYQPLGWDDDQLLVTYDDGLELAVPMQPKRIVSSLPGITEMLCYLGAEEQIVAVSKHCDYPASVKGKPQVMVQPFDAEAVLAQRADVLVADRRLHRRDLSVMRTRVRSILLLDTSRSLPQLASSMTLLAAMLNTDEAKQRAADFRLRVAGLVTRLSVDLPDPPMRVLVVAQWDPLYVLGRGSLIDDLLRVCGCVNVACDLKSNASGTFSEELVLARRPDAIVTLNGPPPDRHRRRWRNVPAIEDGRVIDGESDDLMRAGPRILDGLARLAKALRGAR